MEQHLPAQLSGRQRQRVALARSLITEPEVLLLDEPLSTLDRFVRIKLRGELQRIQKELDKTLFHVTHSREKVLALADLVVVMDQDRIHSRYTGMRACPLWPPCKIRSAITNVLTGRVEGSAGVEDDPLRLMGQSGQTVRLLGYVPSGSQVGFAVRADHATVQLSEGATSKDLARNSLFGITAVVEYADYLVRGKVKTDAHETFVVYVPEFCRHCYCCK